MKLKHSDEEKKMPSMFQPATQIADGTYESSQSTIVFTTGVICVPHTNQTSTRTAISKRAIPYWKTYHIFNKKEHVHVYTSTSVPTHVKEISIKVHVRPILVKDMYFLKGNILPEMLSPYFKHWILK